MKKIRHPGIVLRKAFVVLGELAFVLAFLHGAAASDDAKPNGIQEGDWVWAIDPITGERGPREVVGLIRGNGVKDLVAFTVNGDSLTATSGHPFWVNGRGWVDAGDVRVGDSFLQSDGGVSVVEAVESYSLWTTAYNFEVQDLHTYLVEVDGEGVVVHNCKIKDPNGQIKHAKARHEKTGLERRGASYFFDHVDWDHLLREAEKIAPTASGGGKMTRTLKAPYDVGIDMTTNARTQWYTVVTKGEDTFWTMHPGWP
jgi:hypothetical protein